jgi:DNA-binding transcriptional LysR family regulator
MLTSRQLEYFRAVARELHFTRAAEALHIAQPALSQQIRKLERQLGIELFRRAHNRVELTPAGDALLGHAERILSDLGAVEEAMLGWAGGVRGRVRLGTARGVVTWLTRLLAEFAAAYPGVDVELREETTGEMLDDLYAGRLDAATLAARPRFDDGRLHWHPLGTEPLVLVASASEKRRRIAVEALDGADLVLYGPGSAVREAILDALAAAGATPRVRFETREYSTARALASAGLALAILPRSVAVEPGHEVRVVRLDPEPTWTPGLAWSAQRRPGPAVAAFVEFATASGDISRD